MNTTSLHKSYLTEGMGRDVTFQIRSIRRRTYSSLSNNYISYAPILQLLGKENCMHLKILKYPSNLTAK